MHPCKVLLAGNQSREWDFVLQAIQRGRRDIEVVVLPHGEAVVELFMHDHRRQKKCNIPLANYCGYETISLILIDLDLPKLGGLMVLRQLRWLRRADLSTLPPIVALSTSQDRESIAAAYRYGASGFLCTSVDSQRLVENVEQTVRYWLATTLHPLTCCGQWPVDATNDSPPNSIRRSRH